MDAQCFELRYDLWCGWFLGLLGMGRRFSHVIVDDASVRVAMGWALRATIPRPTIGRVEQASGHVYGWGVHGWRGRWLVNGSSDGLVSMTIDPPVPSRVVGFPGRLRQLRVSLVDPEGFVAALAG